MTRKGSENSIPENGSKNRRWTALSSHGELVCLLVVVTAVFSSLLMIGLVSGSRRYKYNVSMTISRSENPAAVANGFAATVVMLDSHAPNAGPNVNAILKHAPTIAIVEPRCDSSLMSAAMAVASWTLPSLSPPTIRLERNVLKSTAAHHSATDAILPHMLQRRAVRLPYLSDAFPIRGLAMACSRLNKEPKAPPSSTMSYFELIGMANDFLYAFK